MGSQTLEILRQGAWASLTGGWFYDPHQNLFCNTVHLYIWLFLLCLPFTVYLYYPSAAFGWAVYCVLVAFLFSGIKLLNHSLHHMYDTTECVRLPRGSNATSDRRDRSEPREEEGIELQPLGTCRLQIGAQSTDNESVTSIEYHKPDTSTIDLKVDVHRKNSSESSVEDSAASSKQTNKGAHTVSDLCATQKETSAPQITRSSDIKARSRPITRREHKSIKSRHVTGSDRFKIDREVEKMMSREMSSEEPDRGKSEETTLPNASDSATTTFSRKFLESIQRGRSQNHDFFKEWLYLDGAEASGEPYLSKFARQLSSDSRDNSELSIGGGQKSPKKKTPAHRRRYMNESCTKSSIALAPSQQSNMRRNSNSTMSTIQLPLLNSTAQLVSHMRRHSNATDAGLSFLPTGSVELGAYMMEKNEDRSGKGKSKAKLKSSGVRRIKSAALEIGCPPPSVSNLSAHPNSVETIGGQVLKNPKNAVLPPPSKCLMRNPHLNLYPRSGVDAGEGCSYPYLNYGSEIVYPIAEISDEMQTSQKESDLDSVSGESYSDYDEENSNMTHQFQGFDWEPDRSPDGNSSDSDYENNGSRSPLLDRTRTDIRVVRSRTDKPDNSKQLSCSDRQVNKANCPDPKICDKTKSVRLKKINKSDTQTTNKVLSDNEVPIDVDKAVNIIIKAQCTEKEDAVQSRILACVPADYFDKASASSKDLLIEKSSIESNESPLQRLITGKSESQTKKLWDQDISNSSNSLEGSVNKRADCSDESDCRHTQIICDPEISSIEDNNSLYGVRWLFEENIPDVINTSQAEQSDDVKDVIEKATNALGESSSNIQKNLGAIPKQIKNLARSRTSSQKENKKRDSKHKHPTEEEAQNEEMILMDAVEAQAALVQGLECLFAATNANTVVMPTRDERPGSHRSGRNTKTRKRSIEEVAHQSTSTLLPTSMPLLAAFLNSRVDFPHLPIYLPTESNQTPSTNETREPNEEPQRFRPLMDRNHRNRVRKIKRATRKRNNPASQSSVERAIEKPNTESSNSTSVHFATSFNDTTDGAIHCFLDEYGNWMSYTFDKNGSGRAVVQPIAAPEKDDKNPRTHQVKPIPGNDNGPEPTASVGSCVSLESGANTGGEPNKKRGDSVDQSCNSSSNQGSNNPLLASNNNLSTIVPINTNASSTRFYMFDGGTGTHHDQPRSPVAYVTNSMLEQIEAERQSRMGLPSMHINYLMNRNNPPPENTNSNILTIVPSSRSIEERYLGITGNKFRFVDELDREKQPKPKTYYKYKFLKCWQIKVTLDRLQLMALFDRNLAFKETFFSVALAIMVSVLGSLILNLGFYKDIYAFWFCFIMAGSQYSLLKSVQPDSASPVHGFNKMVLFSRPVYFCLCTGILYLVHIHLDSVRHRIKRSFDNESVVLYGLVINETYFLCIIREILLKFLLFFPLAFSLGLFPQVNTFLMYFLEQVDIHIFGGNATSSLSASIYCIFRSLTAVGVIYGFAYSGLIEEKKSQHILFSIFCGLVVPIAYHLSRTASDYTLIWSLIKKHLLPPDLYVIHNPDCTEELEKGNPETLSEKSAKKNNSESNISKQNSIGSSASKINFSSETNISKTQKRSQTSSVSSLKFDPRAGDTLRSSSSLKADVPTESADPNKPNAEDKDEEDMEDPLPKKLQETVNARLKNDLIVCTFLAVVVFGVHCTTVFSTLKPELLRVLCCVAGCLGWVLHYLTPQLRKQQPWLCLSSPLLTVAQTRTERGEPARLMWFEKVTVHLGFLERNVLYPALFVSAVTQHAPSVVDKFGPGLGSLLVSVCTLKCLRNSYSDPDNQYLIVVFTALLFQLDFHWASETFLLDYALMTIIFNKTYEFLLKIQFVITYIAPWQITWGSAFHAFAQPFSVPHSAMLFLQAAISAVLSAPLNPILGSAIFMTSYVRPVKFWERDYNTKRVDQSNTRLSSHLERNLGADDNNLNSIFYEHLTRSLQHYLYGDLSLGRWGQVQQGDCFVLASDYLNCLVHIVEMGNGLVSFQLRGLEFRGTYCQQREVEAISEGPDNFNERCCLQGMLSLSTAWSLRWLAWQLTTSRYVLEGYSVSDNSVVTVLQVFDFRKLLITYYVKSIIYYTIQSSKLEEWLASPTLVEALKPVAERNFVDLDPLFNVNLDEDYDFRTSGITRASFCSVYLEWITYCESKREDSPSGRRERLATKDSPLVTLCFALSLVGRRALGAASHNSISSVEFFLYGLHALFKGDFRIMCARDEWVFADMSLLHSVLARAVRMALKLHQDHFTYPEEYCSSVALYSAISCHDHRLVICHEAAPAWRYNVLRGAPHLLALRHVMDEGSDDYKIIMLNKRQLTFRVIKLNRECVRGLWAGQQQELVYLRNTNPERGSIQNAKQALRNIINSSCDQPIGYPIYVSPLTTSYADTSPQLTSLVGGAVTVKAIKERAVALWRRIRRRCGEGCSSGSAVCAADVAAAEAGVARDTTRHASTLRLSHTSLAGTRGSLASAGKPTSSTLASLATLLREHSHDRTAQPHHEETAAYTTMRETSAERKRKAEDGGARGGDAAAARSEGRGSTRERDARSGSRHSSKEVRQASRYKLERSWRRRERELPRPQSFRLLAAQERDRRLTGDRHDVSALRERNRQIAQPRPPTPDSSLEDLTLNPSGLDLSLPDCKIIANRSAARYPMQKGDSDAQDSQHEALKRMNPELSRLSKDIKHERESYRDLTGKYSELVKDSALSLKEPAKYSDISSKESGLRISGKDFGSKDQIRKDKKEKMPEDTKEIRTKIKRSESAKTELKVSVSVGCKVIIVDPDGVYNCINLGRRIDVQWPSEQQRERGGKNYWGNWVPLEGMDGQVVHKWTPNHRDPKLRSHVDKTILLVQIDDKFVPVAENCVQDLGDEV